MAELSQEQLAFITYHNIPMELVLDATGMRRKDYIPYMKSKGMYLVYGVGFCQRGHLAMRTPSGACVFCNPAYINYLKHNRNDGFIYIAVSLSKKLIKVGGATNVQSRIASLNSQNYGNIRDWKLISFFSIKEIGKREREIHQALQDYLVKIPYLKDGKMVDTNEIFNIDLIELLKKITDMGYNFEKLDKKLAEDYLRLTNNELNFSSKKIELSQILN